MNWGEPEGVVDFLLRKEGFIVAAVLGGVAGFFEAGIGGAIGYSFIGVITYLILALLLSVVIPFFLNVIGPIFLLALGLGIIFGAFFLIVRLADALWNVGKPSSEQSQPVLGPVSNPRSITPMPPPRVPAGPREAILHTTAGIIKMRLLADRSPEHVARFAALAEEGFYDAVQFRRVVPGVLVEANYRSDNPASGPYRPPELSDLSFHRGIVGMSTSGNPLREGWQFFILTDDAPYLNGLYTPLAEVQEGMEVVDNIAQAGRAGRWQGILSVEIR